MSEWKRDGVQRKLVQRQIVELRPLKSKSVAKQRDWLIVYFRKKYNRSKNTHSELPYLKVWEEYRTEEEARAALKSGLVHTLRHSCVCHRDVFNLMNPYWKGDIRSTR